MTLYHRKGSRNDIRAGDCEIKNLRESTLMGGTKGLINQLIHLYMCVCKNNNTEKDRRVERDRRELEVSHK